MLDRFADYWDAKDIHFDQVIYQPLVDPSVRLANLRSGTIDLAEYVAADRRCRGEAGPEAADGAVGCARLFRHHHQPGEWASAPTRRIGQNALVRQAFEPAIDRAGAGQCRVQRHVCADGAGRAAELAVLLTKR